MRRLALRSRLALLTAAAVAVAVAAAAFACWFITRDQLMDELDKSLRQPDTVPFNVISNTLRQDGCHANPPAQGDAPGRFISTTTSAQVVLADGTSCWVQGHLTIPVTEADRQVAARQPPDGALHTVTAGGHKLRVYTAPGITVNGVPAAVSVARPLSDVTDPLTKLAWLLLAVAGVGVVGAASAGLWVARTGLRPVDRLTEAVEHVAATEDLDLRLPVEGEDEIARLGQSFNAMTSALASSRDRQRQLIADAGHELRTPLTSLRTNIELLERSEATGRAIPPEDRRALLASVKAQMTELAALIGDLQELNRPDSAAPSLTVVPLHEITETALRRARLRGPGLTIGADLAPWYVRGEAAALERAIVNLLDNAVKFSPPGGAIDVGLHEGRLTVRDHGPGIPAEELPHVFERFWRSPTARSLPGSGLGLSIVARTVQQAGGTITLAPAEGGGTLATARLPGAPTAPPETLPEA